MPQLTAIQVDVDNNAHNNYYNNRQLVMYEQMFFLRISADKQWRRQKISLSHCTDIFFVTRLASSYYLLLG